MRTRTGLGAAILCALVACAAAAGARAELPQALREVGFDQRLNQQIPLDLELRDEADRPVRLGTFFGRGRPVILVLAYYRCPMLCNLVLNGLVDGLDRVSLDAGTAFEVVVVSFDARETPELAAQKKAAYAARYGRPGAEAGWHFLTGQQAAIDRLTDAVGFRYAYDRATDRFAHASGVVLLTPAGAIFRYLFGVEYPPSALRLGLVEASQEKLGTPVDRVLLFCYGYDPSSGRYTPLVRNLVRLAAAVTLVVLGGAVGRMWWREVRRRAPAVE